MDKSNRSGFLEIFLVRHAQAGHEYTPGEVGTRLSDLGHRQAEKLAKRLAEETFHCIYSSDAKRAMETANAILNYHSHTRYMTSRDIREVNGRHNFRGIAGLPVSRRLMSERKRAKRFCRQLVKNHEAGERVLIVAHGNLIRYVISILAGTKTRKSVPLQTRNTALFIVHYYRNKESLFHSRAVLSLANCVKHLKQHEIS
jgi:alpha-ribazole phosphatase